MRIACFGGACVDQLLWPSSPLRAGGEVTARSTRSYGGVAFNIAAHLVQLGIETLLVSLVGDDDAGAGLIADAERRGIDARGVVRIAGAATAAYVAIFDGASGSQALSDMRIFERFTRAELDRSWPPAMEAEIVFADTNIPANVLTELGERCARAGRRFVVGVSSVPSIVNLPAQLDAVSLVVMNQAEAETYLGTAQPAADAARALVGRGAATAIVTQGVAGSVIAAPEIVEIPPVPAQLVDPTGAGDALIAGTLAQLARGASLADAVRAGTELAARTIERVGATAP